ncbi:hypothetical protein FRC12_000568 [Ceratobasidium sp. 428]|nr:hypothetical protein FRC12_000568 [Ceratobasidium sp. 428]
MSTSTTPSNLAFMRSTSTLVVASVAAAAAASALVPYMLWRKRSKIPLPPSPRSYPIIGNLLDMPKKQDHLGFVEIGNDLKSDMFSLNVFGTVIIVLNNAEDAINLLEKRSNIYSDRPHRSMICEPSLMNWSTLVSALEYGERWRKSRRMMHQWLHKQAVEAFYPSQQRQARMFLQRLLSRSENLDSSEELEREVYRALAGTIVNSVYGSGVQESPEIMTKLKQTVDNLSKAALASNFLVNIFPALVRVPDWFPWTEWKRTARLWREQKDDAIDSPYNRTKSEMQKEGQDPSMVELMLGQAKDLGFDESEIDDYVKEVAFILYGGGTDTTVSAILVFFVAMLLFPNVQRKAQEEIDSVIGPDRLPAMEDRSRLPYVGRLIQEVLRWRPIFPLGLPHQCYQDDVYKGYRIPKGALIFGNIWAINHDAKVYNDPETFDPDRFLDTRVPQSPTFGFGRRLCPGIHYAGSSLFIFIASILAAFKIEPTKDEYGNDVMPTPESENMVIQ